MPARRSAAVLAVLIATLLIPQVAFAQGWVVMDIEPAGPEPIPVPRRIRPPQPVPWTLPLESAEVDVDIARGIAEVKVNAFFRNPNSTPCEGTYCFPLPAGAQIEDFRAVLGGKELAGEVLSADQARAIYEDLVRRTIDPALLEYYQHGLFRARVFPIPAHGEVRIAIRYRQILRTTAGITRFLYPLATARVGADMRADAGASTARLALSMALETEGNLLSVSSPSHKISVRRDGARRATVRLEGGVRDYAGRDFVLDYMEGNDGLAGGVHTYASAGEDGYFLLRLAPGTRPRAERPPMTLFLIVDTSGSMASDGKMEHARDALLSALGRLRESDRFQIIAFEGRTTAFAEAPRVATRAALDEARVFVQGLTARGGTNIDGALQLALESVRSHKDGLVLFISDGAPTVGVTDPRAIVDSASRANGGDFKIHVFGVGQDVNTILLDDLARRNGGSRTYFHAGESLEVATSTLLDKVLEPCLSGIRVTGDGIELDRMEPAGPHDLFFGEDLIIAGRYRGHGAGRVRISGDAGGVATSYVFPADFPRHGGDEGAAYTWAQLRILTLLDVLRATDARDQEGARREIVDLGTRFGIVTPYTSYLVMEEGTRPMAQGINRRLRDAPVARERVEQEEKGFGASSGADSFEYARKQAKRKLDAGTAAGAPADEDRDFAQTLDILQRGGRGLVPLDGRRVDGSLEAKDLERPDRTIVFGSNEYFEFLRANPEAAPLLAAGRAITFRWGTEVIRIDEPMAGEEPAPAPEKPSEEKPEDKKPEKGEYL